jgi:hypothetical protein
MNRINRMGRQTMVAMAVLAVVALTISLGGRFSSIGTIKEGMNDLKGQPISAAIAKLGLPNEEATGSYEGTAILALAHNMPVSWGADVRYRYQC